jgi:KDO2-lipid IV(A) lauroyltransferase
MERRGLNVRKAFLRAVLPLLRALPLVRATRLVSGIGRMEFALFWRLRRRFERAVARGQAALHCEWDVSLVSRELAGNHILWRARDLLLDGVSDERVRDVFVVAGREHLEAAVARGGGCIVLASHFGAHMLPAHWLFRQGFPLRFYMERPRHVSRFMLRHFKSEGPLAQDKLFISRQGTPTDSASSILRAARALKAGMLLYLAGDVRWTGQLTESAQFLGEAMRFSTTWVTLAAMTGAPVVMVFCRMERDGRYHMEFLPPFGVPRTGADGGDAARWERRFLDALEEQVRRHPSNSNEYFFWGEPKPRVA